MQSKLLRVDSAGQINILEIGVNSSLRVAGGCLRLFSFTTFISQDVFFDLFQLTIG